jgi:hypothetical protein
MKAFSKLLTEINEGTTHSAITADMAELLKTVQTTGRSGQLVIKIKVQPSMRSRAGA